MKSNKKVVLVPNKGDNYDIKEKLKNDNQY